MKYVLIIFVLGGGNRPAATTAEFINEQSCQQAVTWVKEKYGKYAEAECFRK